MDIKKKLLFTFFGKKIMEAWFADSFLSAFEDGLPRTNIPTLIGELVWIESRVKELVIGSGFLKPFDNGFIITAKGKMHLDKGGYVGEFLKYKLSRISFWLSIVATIVSITAFFVAIFN